MLAKNADNFIKGAVDLYNEDKLPTLQITPEIGELMANAMFKEFKKAIENPYGFNIQLNQFANFKFRYRHLLAKIADNIDKLRYYRNIAYKLSTDETLSPNDKSPYSRKYTVQEQYEKLLEQEYNLVKQTKVCWAIKNAYMESYTKTARYKRLQKLARTKWEKDIIIFLTKEEQQKGRQTMTPKIHKAWNLDFD